MFERGTVFRVRKVGFIGLVLAEKCKTGWGGQRSGQRKRWGKGQTTSEEKEEGLIRYQKGQKNKQKGGGGQGKPHFDGGGGDHLFLLRGGGGGLDRFLERRGGFGGMRRECGASLWWD